MKSPLDKPPHNFRKTTSQFQTNHLAITDRAPQLATHFHIKVPKIFMNLYNKSHIFGKLYCSNA